MRTADLDVSRLSHARKHPNLDLMIANLTDPGTRENIVRGVDIVYHLASAHLDVRQSENHYHAVNVEATLGLVQAAQAAGVRRFVHCSSVGVIGNVDKPLADENTPCVPTNIYEITKLVGEKAVLQQAKGNGFELVVARPAWVYGPRCPRTRKLLDAVASGRFVIFGEGNNMRHPVYISDAVRGLELCAEEPGIAGRKYIIAGGELITITQLVRVLSEVLDVPEPRIHLPLALGRLAARMAETLWKALRRQPPFSQRSLDFFSKNSAYSIDRARVDLGFAPQVDFRTGILQTLSWNEPLFPTPEQDGTSYG